MLKIEIFTRTLCPISSSVEANLWMSAKIAVAFSKKNKSYTSERENRSSVNSELSLAAGGARKGWNPTKSEPYRLSWMEIHKISHVSVSVQNKISTHLCWLLALFHVSQACFVRQIWSGFVCALSVDTESLLLLLRSHFYSYASIFVMFWQLWPLFSSWFFTLFHSGRAPPALRRFNAAYRERTEKFHILNIRNIFFAHLFFHPRSLPSFVQDRLPLALDFFSCCCCSGLRHQKFSYESTRKTWASNDVTMEFVEIVVLHYPWHFMWLVTWFELSLCREDVYIWVN